MENPEPKESGGFQEAKLNSKRGETPLVNGNHRPQKTHFLLRQKQSKVGSSMDEGKKKRRRTQRLVVIYGPSGNFKQELLKKLQEEYDDVFHYPQIVTTMPSDHPNIGCNTLQHPPLSVDAHAFEQMVSRKDLMCYYHVFDIPCKSELEAGPVSEGQCTPGSETSEFRDQFNERCCGVTRSHSELQLNATSAPMNISRVSKDEGQSGTKCAVSIRTESPPASGSADVSPIQPRKDLISEKKHLHTSLSVRNSAPVGSKHALNHSTLRNTYYFGLTRKAVRDSFNECASKGGITVLLVPDLAARQLYFQCCRRYPNVFIAACEKGPAVTPIRSEHLMVDEVSGDSCKAVMDAINIVQLSNRYNEVSHAELLAYFQSRAFAQEHAVLSRRADVVNSPVNSSKVKIDRSLKAERDLIVSIAMCSYKPSDPLHQRVAWTIFDCLTGIGGSVPMTGKHWNLIGCNDDSSPSSAACGMLTYMHLLYLVSNDSLGTLVNDIYQLSAGGKHFKLLPVVARITSFVAQSLYSSAVQKLCNNRQQIICVLNDLFVGSCLKFYEKYQCASTSQPDVTAILDGIDTEIRNHTRRVLLSVEGHQHGFSFHAQLSSHRLMDESLQRSSSMSDLSLSRTCSAETLNNCGHDRLHYESSAGSQISSPGRSSYSSVHQLHQGKSLTSMKFIGSAPSVVGF